MEHTSEQEGRLLKSAFADPHFDTERWMRKHFVNGTDEQLRLLFADLQKKKELAAHALQNNVFHNYPRFISTSKEIQDIEEDMVEVRSMMTKYGGIVKALESIRVTSYTNEVKQNTPGSKVDPAPSVTSFNAKVPKDEGATLDHLLSELDVYIRERRYREATDLLQRVETIVDQRTRVAGTTQDNAVQLRIEKQRHMLAHLLMHDLQSPALHKSEHRLLISCLVNLGLPNVARDLCLGARSERIKEDIRKLQFEGDMAKHVEELSRTVFAAIATTCDEFCSYFPDPSLSSGLIVWAAEEVAKLTERLRRLVFTSDDFHAMARCVQVTFLYAKLTEEKGLSLEWKLWSLFSEDLLNCLKSHTQRMQHVVKYHIANEDWVARVKQNDDETALTESGHYIGHALMNFAKNAAIVLHPMIVNKVVGLACGVFADYLDALKQQMQSPALTDKQVLAILVNAHHTVHKVLPNVLSLLYKDRQEQNKTHGSSVELALQKAEERVWTSFADTRAQSIVNDKLKWNDTDYSSTNAEVSGPVSKFVRLYEYLSQLGDWLSDELDSSCAHPIVSTILSRVVMRMAAKDMAFWNFEKSNDSTKFGAAGIQQFIVDMRFLMEATTRLKCSEQVHTELMDMIQRVVVSYCRASGTEPQSVIKADEWYAQRIKKGLSIDLQKKEVKERKADSRDRPNDKDRSRERNKGREVDPRERMREQEQYVERNVPQEKDRGRYQEQPGSWQRSLGSSSSSSEKKKRVSRTTNRSNQGY